MGILRVGENLAGRQSWCEEGEDFTSGGQKSEERADAVLEPRWSVPFVGCSCTVFSIAVVRGKLSPLRDLCDAIEKVSELLFLVEPKTPAILESAEARCLYVGRKKVCLFRYYSPVYFSCRKNMCAE